MGRYLRAPRLAAASRGEQGPVRLPGSQGGDCTRKKVLATETYHGRPLTTETDHEKSDEEKRTPKKSDGQDGPKTIDRLATNILTAKTESLRRESLCLDNQGPAAEA